MNRVSSWATYLQVAPLALVFGSFNLGFLPARTRLDWLSRDPAQVDAYMADPLCGQHPTPQLWIDLFGGIIAMEQGEEIGRAHV